MRLVIAAIVCCSSVASSVASADGAWVAFTDAKLGVTLHHPPADKVAVHGNVVEISGADRPTVTITIDKTTERSRSKDGGVHADRVDWTIAVPKRVARCQATTDDPDRAAIASSICDSIELAPGPRDPHLELVITTSGLTDGAAYEQAVHGKARALDACWTAALKHDDALPEGAITIARAYTEGQPATTDERHENFFDHDTKVLAACVTGLVKAVPVKVAAASAAIKVVAICRLY